MQLPEFYTISQRNSLTDKVKILIPINVKKVFGLETLSLMRLINREKLECFIVGGALRNYFFDKVITDIDLATNGRPDEIREILKKEGLEFDNRASKYGTLFVKFMKKRFQITSFRKDIETFGRSAKVKFSRDITDDAKRRDFTFNAIYCSKEGNLVDPLDSFEDLKKKKLKFIGNAEKRIKEDHLRILRFFRFIAELDLNYENIETNYLEAISLYKDNLKLISKERISSELKRIFLSVDPTISLEFLEKTKIYKKFLGSFNKKRIKSLIFFEKKYNLFPVLERRLLSLSIKNSEYFLSRKEKKYYEILKEYIGKMNNLKYLGFILGFEKALDCLIINAVRNDLKITGDELRFLKEGSKQVFPLTFSYVNEKLNNDVTTKEKLEYLKNIWVQSDFKISKNKFIKYL